MKDWLKRNRDWLITLAVLLIFALTGVLWSLFFSSNAADKTPVVQERAIFSPGKDQQTEAEGSAENRKPQGTSSFFLHPDPKELLEKLENLSPQEFREEARELPGLKVMWPAFFFSVNAVENGKAEVIFDASEDGFGALIVSRIDAAKYPQVLTLERGKKIWIAGEISGVDPTGTGQFILDAEYVRFDDYQPPKPSPEKEKK